MRPTIFRLKPYPVSTIFQRIRLDNFNFRILSSIRFNKIESSTKTLETVPLLLTSPKLKVSTDTIIDMEMKERLGDDPFFIHAIEKDTEFRKRFVKQAIAGDMQNILLKEYFQGITNCI